MSSKARAEIPLPPRPAIEPSRRQIEMRPTTVFALTAIAAAAVYLFRIGGPALGASEAFSAWAAAMPSAKAIVEIPVPLDPGKQVFYYSLLHYTTRIFGMSETSLRVPSAIFALLSLGVLFLLGRAMFDDAAVATATSVLWAFNPVIVILARRARMYPMLATVALAHLLLLWQVRRRPEWKRTIACGVLGAVTIYTHLGSLFLIGAEAAMLLRDAVRGRRDPMPWIALAIALVLFIPYFPIFSTQSHALVKGHWLDWIGTDYHFSAAGKIAVGLGAAILALAIVFGPSMEANRDEPLRWCFAWGLLPLVAFLSASVIIRPMFHIRYLIPCVAMAALIIARALDSLGAKMRNLGVVGITALMLVMVPVREITHQPWRQIAARIEREGSPSQPVFFESGFLFFGKSAGDPNGGFPDGYYRKPFDFYFRGGNPQLVVPGYDPAESRRIISEKIAQAGGGWLVTWKNDGYAREELPDPSAFRSTREVNHYLIALYRIEPVPKPR
ncbi:MAG TPA: glycosyltransferase family 39 protein [Candidatus Binataceae bacterium]|nr:glycosyltransferase family 39 protein [Candidatus Binataceae bacterium]